MHGALLQAGYVWMGWDHVEGPHFPAPNCRMELGRRADEGATEGRDRSRLAAGGVGCSLLVRGGGSRSALVSHTVLQSCSPGGVVVWCLVDSSAHRLGPEGVVLAKPRFTRARVRMWKAGREGISFSSGPSFNATKTNLVCRIMLAKMGRGEIDPTRPVAL